MASFQFPPARIIPDTGTILQGVLRGWSGNAGPESIRKVPRLYHLYICPRSCVCNRAKRLVKPEISEMTRVVGSLRGHPSLISHNGAHRILYFFFLASIFINRSSFLPSSLENTVPYSRLRVIISGITKKKKK